MGWVLDLDGVVWLADQPIAGSVEAIAQLREAGERLAFVTNNAQSKRSVVEDHLAELGIDPRNDVITSAMAVAALVEPGERVLACAGPGVVEALEQRGVEVVDKGPADAVVVGKHDEFDYKRLRAASRAVIGGARLLATNTDTSYPTPTGLDPGAGAILAAVTAASGTQPVAVAGKPHDPIAALVREHTGERGIVVGDRADTDGAFARQLGYEWALVLSGVTTRASLPVEPAPDFVADNLASVVAKVLIA